MNNPRFGRLLLALAGCVLLTLSEWAGAEPPSRAARLAYVSGNVSFSPAGQDNWVRAVVNRPLTNGDRLWVDAGSRAELQVGGAAIRLGASTSVTLLNLDDRIVQLELSEGTLKVRVRRMGANQAFEVDTPNLAFFMNRAGDYRIDVDPNDDATAVRVLSGRAHAYGDGASYAVNTRQSYRFYGSGLSDYDRLASRRDDELDRWARDRDRRGDNSPSARYVSSDVVGYQDLDANGTWRRDPEYGNVWTPNRVASGWTPYRDGHWSWVDPWGWTWVDDAPWGYAVSHYGRWANIQGRWSWVPGPQREQAVYAPAQVGFVGGQNSTGASSLGSAAAALIGWFPLAPREVYQPSYTVSRSYFDRINRSNAVVAPSSIANVYNATTVAKTTNVAPVTYVNQRVKDAVVVVPAQAFTHSQPVARAVVPVSKEAAANAPVAPVAAVAPVRQSLHGGDAGTKPPARERERRFVARTAPPPPPPAFAAQQQQLATRPGRPIDDAQRKELKPAAAAVPAPVVKVVTTTKAPAPTAPPPAKAPGARSRDARTADAAKGRDADAAKDGRRDERKSDAGKADAAKAEAAKAEAAKAGAAKADAAKAEAAKTDAAKADAAKADAAKAEAAKKDAAKAETAKGEERRRGRDKADAGRGEAAKADAAKAAAERSAAEKVAAEKAAAADAAKAAAAKAEASKADAAKAEAAKAALAKAEAAKAEAVRAEAAKADAAKAATEKAEAAKAAAAKAEASKADAAKAEAARAEAAKAAQAKAEASRADAVKAEAAKANAANAEAAKAAAAKAEASRVEAAKAEAARADAAKAAAAKAEASRADAAKADAAKIEAAKADAAKAEAAKAALAKAEAAKAEAAKAEASKAEAAKAEPAKTEAGKAEAAKAAIAKAEAAKAAREKARASRTDAEKADDDKKRGEQEPRRR